LVWERVVGRGAAKVEVEGSDDGCERSVLGSIATILVLERNQGKWGERSDWSKGLGNYKMFWRIKLSLQNPLK